MNIIALLVLLVRAPAFAGAQSSPSSSRLAQDEYMRGSLLEHAGNVSQALAAYEKALALDPSAAFIAGEAAELALELDDKDRAEKWARRRLELAPKDADSHVLLGRVLWARGDTAGAEKELETAARVDPDSADVVYALAEVVEPDDAKRARKLLEDFLKRNPDEEAHTLYELGRLDAQEQKYSDAIRKLKKSIDLDSSESDPVRLTLAQVYEVTGDTIAAIGEYKRLLLENPDDLDINGHMAELEAAAGRTSDARETFLEILKKHPDDPNACMWLALDREGADDFKSAAEYLKNSSALDKDANVSLKLGYYQLQSGNLGQAVNTLAAARKHWPQDERVAFYLALGKDDLGDHAQAVKLLREVVSADPDDRDSRWHLATILERSGHFPEAEAEFKRILDDRPDDAPSLNYLGYCLIEQGQRVAEGVDLVKRAIAVEPTNGAYLDSLGWGLFRLGRSTEALAALDGAVKDMPEDETVWGHIGAVRAALGDPGAAWRAWRLAQEYGLAGAGGEADKLEKKLSAETVTQLWRAHLSAAHAGIDRFSGVCDLSARIGGRDLAAKTLVKYLPDDVSAEILSPFFSPILRARQTPKEFTFEAAPLSGLSTDQARGAAQGTVELLSGVWSGAPYTQKNQRYVNGFWHRYFSGGDWRVDIGSDGLAEKVSMANGASVQLTDFARVEGRRIPKDFSARGAFWSMTLTCADPTVELSSGPLRAGR